MTSVDLLSGLSAWFLRFSSGFEAVSQWVTAKVCLPEAQKPINKKKKKHPCQGSL